MVTLLGLVLIPAGLTSLRGLTHVLTCSENVEQPFEVVFLEGEGPILTGSTQVRPNQGLLCGALSASVSVSSSEANRLDLTIPISNLSNAPWRGTVRLKVAETRVQVPIGVVPAGETRSETIHLRLPDGVTTLDGSLLIGP
jgi:hypothetical protein